MSKFFKKYMRKIHRWLVFPFILIMITALANQHNQTGITAQKIQQGFILVLVITGIYLFVLPYWSKWKRKQPKV